VRLVSFYSTTHRRLAQNVLSTPTKSRISSFRNVIVRRSSSIANTPTFNPVLVVAGSIVSGGLGYYLARSQQESNSTQSASKPKYGSLEDFKKAINELWSVLGDEAVSTDPEAVGPYGYSENDYHPGEWELSITKSRVIMTLCHSYAS
jgi:hypothetical protein